ncbi:MAG: hypothetical protein U9N11_06510 [Campylobacterota bacterium]|nr:hypothetical protein [Campylobacterota bacterium]
MSKYALEDYNRLAYEFAIRNPRVIELLKSELNDEVADELLNTYGISIKKEVVFPEYDEEGNQTMSCETAEINSLDEVYLDYPHLKGIKTPSRGSHKGFKRIINTEKLPRFKTKRFETETEAMKRISNFFETRGRSNKLNRLMGGEVFEYYDAVRYDKKTIYSLDPSTKKKGTIGSDITLVDEWIKPEKYLELLPKIINLPITYNDADYYQ